MTSDRWQRVETLFEQALEASEGDRPQLLEAIGDAELRQEVESLLHAHGQAGAFLDDPDRFFSSESIEADTLSPGQIIDRYRIIREIGRGGMGAVFLAERADDEYQKQVALKLIKRGTDTESVLRHFRNERQILAGFDHANIARLFDGGTTESGLPYFVMEYVEGLPIDEYCNGRGLSVIERLKLFREVCAAVSYAHRHLVIHRDIKRSNILVTAEGVPKLLDFGIAKLLQEGDEPLATMTGMRLMTPQSASPEQVRGEPVTTASDVYSLGVVLYELLCGRSPYEFPSQSAHEMARVITEFEPKKPSTAVARGDGSSKLQAPSSRGLKGDLDNIVLMALRKEPERRYQSVEQFSEDIRRHLEARPVLARKDTISYRAGKFARRNKAGLAAAALVLLILVGGIVATSRQAQIALREQARAERRFNDVRKLANRVLFDYHDAIKFLPGATKVRELLVQDALNYLDSLAGEAQGDPELQRELSAAYERVGDVRGGLGASLGDRAGALESYMKALKIREALVTVNPRDTQGQRDLARNHQKVGFRLLFMDPRTGSLEHLRKAVAIYVDLTREHPSNGVFQLELADTRNKLARALKDHGDPAGAREQNREALELCEKMVASNPRDHEWRRALFNAHQHTAALLWSQGEVAGAIEANRKTIEIGERLMADDPLNTEHRRAVVISYDKGGDYRGGTDFAGALEYYRRALALEEESLAADPANPRTRENVALMHKKVADFLANTEDNAQALVYFSKARELFEKVAATAPEDLSWRFRVAISGIGAAGMHARLGQIDPALQECRKAIVLLGEIKEDPANTDHRIFRAEAYEYLGYAYGALAAFPKASPSESKQHMTEARDMFQQSLNVLEELRSRGALNAPNAVWAKSIVAEIAKCDTALGR